MLISVDNFNVLVFAFDLFNETTAWQPINERAVSIYTACDCLLGQKSFSWLEILILDL